MLQNGNPETARKATPKINYVGRRVGKLLRNPPFAARGRRCVEKGGGLRKSLPTLQPKLLFLGDA